MNTNTNNIISISSSAVLIDLSIKGWEGKKLDRAITQEVAINKNAHGRAGQYQKNLFADCVELASITKLRSAIRNWSNGVTYPWGDNGVRLLEALKLESYLERLGELKARYYQAVEEFLDNYPLHIQAAQFALGDAFDRDDYPDAEELRPRFGVYCAVLPVPEAGDFRVDIGVIGVNDLTSRFEQEQQRRVQEAIEHQKQKIKTQVGKLAHTLRVEDDGKRGRVHDKTIEGLLEMCEGLDGGLFGDPEIAAIKTELWEIMGGVDASDLRDDDFLRERTKSELDSLLDKFNW